MTKAEFRQIIREEVGRAIQSELRDILVEAVKIASTPEEQPEQEKVYTTEPGLNNILRETAAAMIRPDLSAVSKSTVSENMDGLPSFARNAAAIFEASNKIRNNAV